MSNEGCIHCGTEDVGRFDKFDESDPQPLVCRDCLDTLAETVGEKVESDLNGILAERVSDVVGHKDWPGDVDPPIVHAYTSALRSVVRQLLENGFASAQRPPARDVQIIERSDDPERPDWIPPFSVFVDGVFKGDCKTRENAERAAAHERVAPKSAEERAVELLAPLAEDPRVKYVGVEHTGGGCMCAAVYLHGDNSSYVWITPSEGYVEAKDLTDGEFLVGVYEDHDSGEWNDDLSGQHDGDLLLVAVRSILDQLKVEAAS